MNRKVGLCLAAAVGVLAPLGMPAAPKVGGEARPVVIEPKLSLKDRACSDQDDMCIWAHPADASRSVVIVSDKAAELLIVYDLAGETVQTVQAEYPGNIDVRYGFPLGGKKVDIVAYNQRTADCYRICVWAIDPDTRKLRRVDDGKIATDHNYGGTMYRSLKTGKFYFVTTAAECQQVELFDDGKGKVTGRQARRWKTPGYTEGAVGDDEAGKIYYAVESKGLYEVGGEPEDPTPGKIVAPVDENGLQPDVEGVAIYHLPKGKGYLLVSSQGNSRFNVYRRGSCEFVGAFRLSGVSGTDGVDVTNVPLGKAFPSGLFACHTDSRGACPVVLTPWQDIARALRPPLEIDTTWDPRKASRLEK